MAAGGYANDATLRFRQREWYRCDQGALLMHLDCSCALVRPLDGQPHQSPSAGIWRQVGMRMMPHCDSRNMSGTVVIRELS